MAGVWKKTMQYLGLVEDDDLEDLDDSVEAPESGGESAHVH